MSNKSLLSLERENRRGNKLPLQPQIYLSEYIDNSIHMIPLQYILNSSYIIMNYKKHTSKCKESVSTPVKFCAHSTCINSELKKDDVRIIEIRVSYMS